MKELTIRNVPDDIASTLKKVAEGKGISMEEEVWNVLQKEYRSKQAVLDRIRSRWDQFPPVEAAVVDEWIREGRE